MHWTMEKKEDISDRSLVERFRQGDESAFDLLVERHAGHAYRIAYGVLGSREDAEEVAQDVFVKVHRALAGFRGESEFSTWLYRITMNLAKNKYRWNKSRGEGVKVSIDAPLDGDDENRTLDVLDGADAPDEARENGELLEALQDALAKLPEVYRTPLLMWNAGDVSYERIAEILDCKVGTVKSRINRGRSLLKEMLGMRE